ncbi:MAG: hypothetical protein UHD09_04360, partial [Bifidobacterium sp.]|nr:hypothetical protein [Bifidobacterium sp.]
ARGPSSWCRVLSCALRRGDRAMREHGDAFLHRVRRTVRARGLAGWLSRAIGEADDIMLGRCSAEAVPATLCAERDSVAEQRLRKDPATRFGSMRARAVILTEHSMEAYRLAAHVTAAFGGPQAAATRTAYRLVTMPFLGQDLLETAAHTCARCQPTGRCADCRSRTPMFGTLLATLESLRLQADAEYAQAQARGEADEDLGAISRTPQEAALDQRYQYDLRMLLDGYDALWDEDIPDRHDLLIRSADEPWILRDLEDRPLWRNPLYLYEATAGVMGGPLRQQLAHAFDARDRAEYERTVDSVRAQGRLARDFGTLVLPAALTMAPARAAGGTRVHGRAQKADDQWLGVTFRDAGLIIALERMPLGDGITTGDLLSAFYRFDMDAYLKLVESVTAKPFDILKEMAAGEHGGLRWTLA